MLQDRVQALLDDMIWQNALPCCSVLVLHKGEEVLYAQAGLADREKQIPLSRNHLFRLFSMSKPITAVAAMILVEEGKLSLAEVVKYYLPGFENLQVWDGTQLVKTKRELLVWDLLHMSCGLPYPGFSNVSDRATGKVFEQILPEQLTTQEVANRFGQCPMLFHPRDSFVYGVSTDIMGAVIEAASGMRFGEFLKKRIFEPLGMEDTGFWVPPEKQHLLTKTYGRTPEGTWVEDTQVKLAISVTMDQPPRFESGGAGLVGSIDDYAKFGAMLLNGGTLNGHRILSSRTVKMMEKEDLFMPELVVFGHDAPGYSYGSFMRHRNSDVMPEILASKGEYGWGGALATWFSNSPEEGVTMVMMTQKGYAGFDVWTDVRGRLYNLIMSDPEMEARFA